MGFRAFKASRVRKCKAVQMRYFTSGELSRRQIGAFEGGGADFDAFWLKNFAYAGLPFDVKKWRWLDRHETLEDINGVSQRTGTVVWKLEFVAGQSDEGAVKRGYRKCVRTPEPEWHQGISSLCCEWIEAVDMSA